MSLRLWWKRRRLRLAEADLEVLAEVLKDVNGKIWSAKHLCDAIIEEPGHNHLVIPPLYTAVQVLSKLEGKLAYYEKAFEKQRERVLTMKLSLRNNVPEARVVSSDTKGRSRDKMMEEP